MAACALGPEVVAVGFVGGVGHGHAAQERLLALLVASLLLVRARGLCVVPVGEKEELQETGQAGSLVQ